MRCVVLGLRNAVRCEIWCYGDIVIWPALQARAFALVIYLIVVRFVRSFVRRRSSYPKNPPNCARCCWRARVPVKWHLADLRFRFLAREIDLKSWNHVFYKSGCTVQSIMRVSARIIPPVDFWRF